MESDYYGSALQIFGPFGDHVAFMLFLVHFVDQDQPLAAPDRRSEGDESAAGVHAQSFGPFMKGFTLDCSSINQHRQLYPQPLAVPTLGRLVVYATSLALIGRIARAIRFRATNLGVRSQLALPPPCSIVTQALVNQADRALYQQHSCVVNLTLNFSYSCRPIEYAG